MTNKQPKTPLGGWPGGARPNTAAALQKNLTEARKRLDACLARKSELWKKIMDESEDGFIQRILRFRDEAEEQSQYAIKLEKLIEQWTDKLRSMAASDLIEEQNKTSIYLYSDERGRQQKVAGG